MWTPSPAASSPLTRRSTPGTHAALSRVYNPSAVSAGGKMKTKLILLTLLVAPWLPAQQPAVPRVTYLTGVVKDSAGKPQTGMLGITFSLYEEQQGGVPLWTETQSVSLDEHGGYAVLLGAMQQGGLPVELFSSGKARWLGIAPQLPGAQEQPRVALAGVPYALKAVDADTLGGLPASAFLHVDTP